MQDSTFTIRCVEGRFAIVPLLYQLSMLEMSRWAPENPIFLLYAQVFKGQVLPMQTNLAEILLITNSSKYDIFFQTLSIS